MNFVLELDLLSDARFGRGTGIGGYVDNEIDFDERTGLPVVDRAIKGLLVQSCGSLLFALRHQRNRAYARFERAAVLLFGTSGEHEGHVRFSLAQVDDASKRVLESHIAESVLSAEDVLEALTTVVQQTQINSKTGVAKEGSLRSSRALLKGMVLELELSFDESNDELFRDALALLCACVRHCRRGGLRRHRGSGKFRLSLFALEAGVRVDTSEYFDHFESVVLASEGGVSA